MLHSQLERSSSFNLSSNPLSHEKPVSISCHNIRMGFPFCGWGPSTDCRIVGVFSTKPECKQDHPSSLILLHTKPPNCMFSFQGYNSKNSRRPSLSFLHQPGPKSLTPVKIVSIAWRGLDQVPNIKEQKQGENEELASNAAAWNSCLEVGTGGFWG